MEDGSKFLEFPLLLDKKINLKEDSISVTR